MRFLILLFPQKEAIKVKIILQYMYQEKFFGCKKMIFYFFLNFIIEHELLFKCLTDTDQEKYSSIDIIRDWEESFNERQNVLNSRKKKKSESLNIYFGSFPCIRAPIGIPLVKFTYVYYTQKNV